jgi:hypothetical protein
MFKAVCIISSIWAMFYGFDRLSPPRLNLWSRGLVDASGDGQRTLYMGSWVNTSHYL